MTGVSLSSLSQMVSATISDHRCDGSGYGHVTKRHAPCTRESTDDTFYKPAYWFDLETIYLFIFVCMPEYQTSPARLFS